MSHTTWFEFAKTTTRFLRLTLGVYQDPYCLPRSGSISTCYEGFVKFLLFDRERGSYSLSRALFNVRENGSPDPIPTLRKSAG